MLIPSLFSVMCTVFLAVLIRTLQRRFPENLTCSCFSEEWDSLSLGEDYISFTMYGCYLLSSVEQLCLHVLLWEYQCIIFI